jgi:hypothetical protein
MCANEDEIFDGERKTIDDEERSGRPFGITDDHRAEVDELIKGNRRTSIREIALTVGISYGSAFTIDHDYRSDHDS